MRPKYKGNPICFKSKGGLLASPLLYFTKSQEDATQPVIPKFGKRFNVVTRFLSVFCEVQVNNSDRIRLGH